MQKIRLFINKKTIKINDEITLDNSCQDFQYLATVMRRVINDEISIFNGLEGDFAGKIIALDKKKLTIKIIQQTSKLSISSNINLAFSLIKKNEIIAIKATELGIVNFIPLITNNSVIRNFNQNRFFLNIKEACEQSQRNDIPKISDLQHLDKWLSKIDFNNKIYFFCDESGDSPKISHIFNNIKDKNQLYSKIAQCEIFIIIGPEGGFSCEEKKIAQDLTLKNKYFFNSISLGKQILRAETAAIVAIAIIKEIFNN